MAVFAHEVAPGLMAYHDDSRDHGERVIRLLVSRKGGNDNCIVRFSLEEAEATAAAFQSLVDRIHLERGKVATTGTGTPNAPNDEGVS